MPSSKSTSPTDPLPWKLIYVLRGAIASAALLVILVFWLVSRADRSEIKTYRVQHPIEDRMLAAMIPSDSHAWFFKLTGPAEQITELRDSFQTLLESVKLDKETERLSWTAPPGWRQLPDQVSANKMDRVATLVTSTDQQGLEVTVTKLAMPTGGWEDYVLLNVNRWRSQMQLSRITAEQLPGKTTRIDAAGVPVILVEIAGRQVAEAAASPPLTSGAPGVGDATAAADERPPEPTFEVPDLWQPSRGTSLSLFAYQVTDNGGQVQITVTPLAPSGLLANVNRWCRQIAMKPLTQDQLDREVEKIKLGTAAGDFIELKGPQQTILGVVAVHDQWAWFIKLMGDPKLAQQEKERFRAFAESFRFETAEGANHGD